jgi:hypothetical protein
MVFNTVFLSPKIVLQYLVCIFSYDVLSSSDKESQVLLFLSAQIKALYIGR